jgi:peptidoglycan-associated lipoprotein
LHTYYIAKLKMKRLLTSISLFICLLVLSLSTQAQYTLKQADNEYNLYNYSKAVDLYLKEYKKKPTYYIAEHIATCYHLLRDYANQETWYANAISLDGTKPEDILNYANALKSNGKYKEAKAEFTRYYILSRPTDTARRRFYTTACDSAVRWMNDSAKIELVEIKNEYILNSPKSDWGAVKTNNSTVFTSDRGELVEKNANTKKPFLRFDSRKGLDKKVYQWTDNGYLKLYKVDENGKSADVLKLFPVDAETEYHIGAASFTADGNEMFFTVTRLPRKFAKDTAKIKTINLEIYSCKRSGSKWGTPVAFKYNNATKFSNDDPFIMPDGKMLYFVSDRPGGAGGTDIYTCVRDAGGNWSTPLNLKAINTFGNERTPLIDANKNLYFASDGYKGMGGLDIFKAASKGNGFGTVINLAYPINSPQDDFAYTLQTDSTGFFSSNRPGGQGSDDIYSYTTRVAPCYRLDGFVYLKGTITPIANSTVTLAKVKGKTIKVHTDATGAFTFCLTKKSNYALRGEKTGYLVDNETVTTIGLEPGGSIKKDLYLDKIELNKAIRLENIYYDLDKSFIRPDAAKELNKLIKIMKDNPTLVIELGSHTDSRGSDQYNLELSQRRAVAAVRYITEVGDIDENRLTAHGYGETRPLNRCTNGVACSVEEFQLNRRTEFKILKY